MPILPWLLAGLAVALSGVALAVAAYFDVQDHRRRRALNRDVFSAKSGPVRGFFPRAPLRMNEGPLARRPDPGTTAAPDIVIGPWEAGPAMRTAGDAPVRKAA